MSKPLPRLRGNLDFMPSPDPQRPGLLIRDAYRYSDATLIIPPALVEALRCFDGETTDLDLRAELVRITGDLSVGELERNIIDTLAGSGFLEDENYARMREARQREFAAQPVRTATHVGSAYPEEPGALRETLAGWMNGGVRSARQPLMGIAAPHVSPEGGWKSYQAAYAGLTAEYKDRTFVVLGTSHYGEPERFGLTRKPFETPLGKSAVDLRLVDALANAAPDSILMEDYCHSIEHSIEFQALFLQYVIWAGYPDPADSLRVLRAQHLWRRGAGRRRTRAALSGRAGRVSRKGRCAAVLGAGHRHGAYGPAVWRPAGCAGGSRRDVAGGRPGPGAHRSHQRGGCARILGPGSGAARRFEMVRVVTAIHIFEGCAASARRVAALRAVEYRRPERGQFRGHLIQ
jgi:Predicted dioxygenase